MITDKVLAHLQAEPGLGESAAALASSLGLDSGAVETALESLRSQGLVRCSVGGNWFVPKPAAEEAPDGKSRASHRNSNAGHHPGAQQVWLVHSPELAADTALHLSFKEGTGHYRLRRYLGGDPTKHGRGYEVPGIKTVQELRREYGPFLQEADFTDERPRYQAIEAWRQLIREFNARHGIG